MPSYAYEARDALGHRVQGVKRAPNEAALDRLLQERQLLLIRTSRPRRRSVSRRMKRRALIDFCYHLGTVLEAGIPLLDGLRDLQEEGRSALADELDRLILRIEGGSRFSDALRDSPRVFPPLVCSLVAAGEESGSLDRVLRDLVSYLEWREDLRRQLIGALTYPAIVLCALFALCVVLTTLVLPRFLELFVELGVDLPLPTRILLAGQRFFAAHGLLLLGGAGALVFAAVLYVRTETGRRRYHALLLRLPLMGKLVAMTEMSRFAHNLGLLYGAGIPISRALELILEVVQNRVFREMLSEAKNAIRRGESLAAALSRSEAIPLMVRRMIALGEESGRLEESLEHVSRYYDRELPLIISSALAVFNAAVLVLLGVLLVGVALAIFVPLYSMLGSLNA